MIILKESTGDIKLCKFIVILIDKIPGILEQNYYEDFEGYFFLQQYTYNTITETIPDYITHEEMLAEIFRIFKYVDKSDCILGYVDVIDSSSDVISTNLFITDIKYNIIKLREHFTEYQIDFILRMVSRYLKSYQKDSI